MITSIHTLLYSDDAPATRAFLRDVLGWRWLEDTNSEPGWLIFRTGPSELGVHPIHSASEGQSYERPQHEISLMCDDIEATRDGLISKGATFSSEIVDEGYGLTAMLEVPGTAPIMLYQPKHPTAYDL